MLFIAVFNSKRLFTNHGAASIILVRAHDAAGCPAKERTRHKLLDSGDVYNPQHSAAQGTPQSPTYDRLVEITPNLKHAQTTLPQYDIHRSVEGQDPNDS